MKLKTGKTTRRMKGIPVPNYTINKGTLAENMATAAVEYPFTLAENMVGRPEELQWRRLVGGTGDKYQIFLAYRVIIFTGLGAETYKITKNPYRSAGVAIALTITQDEMIDKATKSIKENTLNKDVEK